MRALLARSILALLFAEALGAQERIPLDGTWSLRAEPLSDSPEAVRQVAVPAAFETALGTGFDGVAWYRRPLPVTAAMRGARIRIEFAAAATHATVLCNGKEIVQHLGPWTPFRADVTDALQWNGSDVLEVRVDEQVGHNTQGFLPIIEPHFGGLWQGVTLCVDRGPVLDRLQSFLFASAHDPAQGVLRFRVPVLGATPDLKLRVAILDGASAIASSEVAIGGDGAAVGELAVPAPRRWAPGQPHRYGVRLDLLAANRRVDREERSIGFRSLQTDGTKILWNQSPLQVRGVLHWGYSPPHLAPPTDPLFWRRQLEDWKSLGFNLVKCCLWVPPSCFYELCDELGLLVWQEYPTWHPQMDQAHKPDLLREYGEFFLHDGSHPSVAIRSLTCETGQGADLDVVKSLYDACKAAVPDTLVVDDSSWIGWQRVTDFWDEHPYGNNRWWPGRLAEFEHHIAEKGRKPLLLGECIAADTWADRARWVATYGDEAKWWRPDCFGDQGRFEAWILREFGAATLASLGPTSREYAMRTRQYQIEKLRTTIPEAGYVVSVARDFGKARMGLYDDFDQLKWKAADWAWQADTMLCFHSNDDARAFPQLLPGSARVRVAHHGPSVLDGNLVLSSDLPGSKPVVVRVHAEPGQVVAGTTVPDPWLGCEGRRPVRRVLTAELQGGVRARASWALWCLPRRFASAPPAVEHREQFDLATLNRLLAGGKVFLHENGRKHSFRSEGKWYLTGAPFAPPHPFHARVPAELLVELQPFDLDGGRLMPWRLLRDQVDPILAFWETHDLAEVREHLFAFDCRVGEGRLLVSCLDEQSVAGAYVAAELAEHLAAGPAPQRALTPATIDAIRALLAEKKIELPTWRFRTDPGNEGLAGNWHDPKTDVGAAGWRDLKAGSHWENQGEDLKHYTGIAWYRVDVAVPADWQGLAARAVFEGVDDSFTFWLDGERIGSYGDPATGKTIWLEPQVAELGDRLRPGPHTLVLRVVDHAGAGGLWKPVFLTTGPAGELSTLLQ